MYLNTVWGDLFLALVCFSAMFMLHERKILLLHMYFGAMRMVTCVVLQYINYQDKWCFRFTPRAPFYFDFTKESLQSAHESSWLMCFLFLQCRIITEQTHSLQIFILSVCLSTPQRGTAVILPARCLALSFTQPHCDTLPSTVLCSTFNITNI